MTHSDPLWVASISLSISRQQSPVSQVWLTESTSNCPALSKPDIQALTSERLWEALIKTGLPAVIVIKLQASLPDYRPLSSLFLEHFLQKTGIHKFFFWPFEIHIKLPRSYLPVWDPRNVFLKGWEASLCKVKFKGASSLLPVSEGG